jgi:hypothetical protein
MGTTEMIVVTMRDQDEANIVNLYVIPFQGINNNVCISGYPCIYDHSLSPFDEKRFGVTTDFSID